jgi:hypothetical protein
MLQPTTFEASVRIWRGWTPADRADEYAAHLREVAIPALEVMDGNLGVFVLRRRLADGVEFKSVSVWESAEAMRRAGMAEDHAFLVGRQTIPAQWEVVASADAPVATAA